MANKAKNGNTTFMVLAFCKDCDDLLRLYLVFIRHPAVDKTEKTSSHF
jgi:hypothetical protein